MDSFWKNKKVTAFVALKHHTRFIIPIMEEIASLGADVKYLVAQAERSQEITAIETNLEYSHIFDFINKSDTDEIYKNYHIMRKGFASALLKDKIFNLQMTTVLDKTLFSTAQEYIGFKNYLEHNKIDLCIALHEINRWGKMFAFHAKKQGVPLITLQEGLYTTATSYYDFIHTGHAQYSVLNLVWGQKTKDKLAHYEAPEEKIIPAGNTHITHEINKLKQNNTRSTKRKEYKCNGCFVVLLLFSINLIPKDELFAILNIVKEDNNFKLFIKFHPATVRKDIDTWCKDIPDNVKNLIHFIHGEEDTYCLMAISDLCVLIEASTTGLEALALGKPLIELDLNSKITYDFSLAEENAALKLTPDQLSQAIKTKQDFSSMMDQKGIQNYLKSELHESDKSIKTVINILQSVIQANDAKNSEALISEAASNMTWSIIIPVVNSPDNLITVLESVALYSENEDFEVILIKPKKTSKGVDKILQSLEGDVSTLTMGSDKSLPEMMNLAGIKAKGECLLFLDKNLLPNKDWLATLKKGIAKFGKTKLFGAKIINSFNNIIHAGIVVDVNNCPVSAYAHLDSNFPHTCKTRSFQMLNYFAGIDKDFFLSIGGFNPHAGRYLFMDLCLKARELTSDEDTAIYLSDIELTQIEPETSTNHQKDSIFFYSKWHGTLWENEGNLYKEDGVSNLQLNAARMTRAMETISNH